MQLKGKGATIRYALADSPLDRMLVARTEVGLCAVAFGDTDETLRRELHARYPEAQFSEDTAALAPEISKLLLGFQQEGHLPTFPYDVAGTAFERRVWAAMAHLPRGTTMAYGQFAASLGLPKAQRAVGAAIGKNPLALLYPCHRLVAKGGHLHRYRWGLQRKRWLLAHEGASGEPAEQGKLPLADGQLE